MICSNRTHAWTWTGAYGCAGTNAKWCTHIHSAISSDTQCAVGKAGRPVHGCWPVVSLFRSGWPVFTCKVFPFGRAYRGWIYACSYVFISWECFWKVAEYNHPCVYTTGQLKFTENTNSSLVYNQNSTTHWTYLVKLPFWKNIFSWVLMHNSNKGCSNQDCR
jgi:hypothetical protein